MATLILCYHHIDYGERIDPETFEQNIVTLIKKGFHPITLTEMCRYIRRGEDPPYKSVHITFDDGYADNYFYAYPILKKYGFFATIFVIASRVASSIKRATSEELASLGITQEKEQLLEKSPYVSWEELDEMVKSGIFEVGSHSLTHSACFASKRIVKFNDTGNIEWLYRLTGDKRLGIPIYEKKWDCATLCLQDDKNFRDFLAEFVSENGGKLFFKDKKKAYRTLYKLCKYYLKHYPVEFKQEDELTRFERMKKEICGSKVLIEEKLNRHVDFFCYPWGDYDILSVNEVRKCYKAAVTLDVGLNDGGTYPYLLKRVEVRGGDWLEKRLKIYSSPFLTSLYAKVYHKL